MTHSKHAVAGNDAAVRTMPAARAETAPLQRANAAEIRIARGDARAIPAALADGLAEDDLLR
jgi:hypothetical protein